MKQLSSADFRKQYAAISEPVEVTNHGKVVATFIPTGYPFTWGAGAPAEVPDFVPDPEPPGDMEVRMSIRPVKGDRRPLVAASEKRIVDPIQRGKSERDIFAQLAAKMDPSEGSRRR